MMFLLRAVITFLLLVYGTLGAASALTGAVHGIEVLSDVVRTVGDSDVNLADFNFNVSEILRGFSGLDVAGPNLSAACSLALDRVARGLTSGKVLEGWKSQSLGWKSLLMLDASAKLPLGILGGNRIWLGDITLCHAAEGQTLSIPDPIKTKYCSVGLSGLDHIYSSLSIPTEGVTVGLCLPAECSQEDILSSINFILAVNLTSTPTTSTPTTSTPTTSTTPLSTPIPQLEAKKLDCDTDRDWSLRIDQISFICIFTCLLLLVLLGTVLEHKRGRHGGVFYRHLLSFSLIYNSSKLLSTSPPPSTSRALLCLHGLRTLSMFWIILGHTYFFVHWFVADRIMLLGSFNGFHKLVVLNGTFAVDTFFFISGLLVVYVTMQTLWKQQQENSPPKKKFWIIYILHRYWRLTPLYMFVIYLLATVYRRLLDGAMYYHMTETVDHLELACQYAWWPNMFYLNNLHPLARCLPWSWYLAIDFQLYIFTPIFLALYRRSVRVGVLVTVCILICCMAGQGIQAGVLDLGIESFHQSESYNENKTYHVPYGGSRFLSIYTKPWSRASPYLVGMLVGLGLAKMQGRKRTLRRWLVICLWCLTSVVMLLLVYGLVFLYQGNIFKNVPQVSSVAWHTLSRATWALGLAWIVVACVWGYGGVVNSILSWPKWQPLSRLTYCAYLIHPLVMYQKMLSSDTSPRMTDLDYTYEFISYTVVTYAVCIPFCLMVEAPCMAMERIWLGKEREERPETERVGGEGDCELRQARSGEGDVSNRSV